MKRGTVLGIAIASVAIIAAFAWAFAPRPVPVEIATVREARFEQTVDEDGKTRVRNRYVISAPLTGRLARITLDVGDRVTAGAPVARLTPTAPALLDARTVRELHERVGAAEANLVEAQAEVARAAAVLEQARTDLARQRKLEAEGFLSSAGREQTELTVRTQGRALEAAHAARHAADHTLAQARAALMQAREPGDARLRPLAITSPVTGRVLKLDQQSEAVVPIGTPLLEIADADDLEMVIDVLSTDATRITEGSPVAVDAGSGAPLAGRVRRIEPAAFTKVSALGVEEQRVNVIVDFLSPPEQWRTLGDGFRVDAKIVVLAREQAVVVPVAALFRQGADWNVFVIEGGRARLRAVKVGGRNPTEAWIEEGLEPGERVIVYPGDTVTDGRRVTVVRGP